MFLAAIGYDETPIEASFCEAIRTAKRQKSVSLAKRAEGTYAECRRQKASTSGGRGFRLALCTARSALSLGLVVGSTSVFSLMPDSSRKNESLQVPVLPVIY